MQAKLKKIEHRGFIDILVSPSHPFANNRKLMSRSRLNIRKDVFPQDLVRTRSHEIDTLNFRIALKFDRHIGSTAAEVPVKFESDTTIPNTNLAASRFYEILRKDVFRILRRDPGSMQ